MIGGKKIAKECSMELTDVVVQPTPPRYVAVPAAVSTPLHAQQHDAAASHAPLAKQKDSSHSLIKRPCREHTFITNIEDVRQMELGLNMLLNDFNQRQRAFDMDSSFEKLDKVREEQERLSHRHFEMDQEWEALDHDSRANGRGAGASGASLESEDGRNRMASQVDELMAQLDQLSNFIQDLQKNHPKKT